MRNRLIVLLGGLLAAQPPALAAQRAAAKAGSDEPASRHVEAGPVADRPPQIDGRLDDPVWATARPAADFVQMRPSPGEPASRPAEARVVYDENAVYVAMRLYDEPDSVVAQLARRDASGVFTDWAHVLIDSYHDRRTAFRFSVSPHGTKKDVLHFNDTQEDLNWDAVWEAAARVDSLGWTAEFRIPLSQLRFSAKEGGDLVWGINFGREIARYGEWSWWSPVLPNSGGLVSESGELRGLSGLASPRRLEVLPYSVGRLTRAPEQAGNPFYEASDPSGSLGVDLRYGLTSNLTLSATFNPDFGQVEADPSVVNLSAYESFFPEKRPFFMEGANIFEFGVGTDDGSGEGLFYSRRIGRSPQRSVDAGDGWVNRPEATTILGAAKLSGRTAGGWTIGLLDAVTGEEAARVAQAGGDIVAEPVEPLSNYLVGSLSRDFGRGESSVGALLTATNRRLGEGDEFAFLRSAAYAAGVRGRHRFAAGSWEANAYVGGSHIRGSEAAIQRVQLAPGHYFHRPDAEHLEYDPARTSLSGMVANLWLSKIGGSDHWRGGFGGHLRTPGFEVNDLGFQSSADEAMVFGNLRYHQFQPTEHFRNWFVGLNPSTGWTTGGERIWSQVNLYGSVELHNFWYLFAWSSRRLGGLSPDALRGGPALRRDGGYSASFTVNSDRRKPVMLNLNFGGNVEDETGGGNVYVSPGVTVRPSGRLNLSLSPNINWNQAAWQYVGQPRVDGVPHYIFGALDQTTFSVTTRLNYTISPTLSFELYTQPFVSGVDYTGFMEVADPRAATFDERFAKFTGERLLYDAQAGLYRADGDGDGQHEIAFGNPDFNLKQLRGNAVLRWEYLPGSTLFLVWSQSRSAVLRGTMGDEIFDLGRDVNRLFNRDEASPVPVTNVFLVKVNYWLNF